MSSNQASPADLRNHEDYFDQERWTVVDVEAVDRVGAYTAGRLDEPQIRLDVDGEAATSSEVGEHGERLNLSVWLSPAQALNLAAAIVERGGGDGD